MDYHLPEIAELYDLANPLAEDGLFYLSLAGSSPSDVLDLGCGTGVLSCALAGCGHRVTAVDPAAAMLSIAKQKPYAERVTWRVDSAQTFRSEQRFDWIFMTGHAFQVLLTDDEIASVFATMRLHLRETGRVAFETRNPAVDWAREWNARPPRSLPGGLATETLTVTAADGEFISFTTAYQLSGRRLTTSSTLRFPAREEVEKLLQRCGLRTVRVLGDWGGGVFAPQRSREMIFIAELAK